MITKSFSAFQTKSLPFREALLASGVMAFAGIGDALLYPLLPIYGQEMGFSVFFIGLLLSVNRLVRIMANTAVANWVNRLGTKKILMIGAVTAVLSTAAYGLEAGAVIFLMARIAWGLSYSGLKLATLTYAAEVPKGKGLAFGSSTSIKTLGILFALFFGPLWVDAYGVHYAIFLISMVSMGGIILSFALPAKQHVQATSAVTTKRTFSPTPINLLIFITSIAIDGILVVGLAHLLGPIYADKGALLSGVAFYLLLKRLSLVVLSMLSGLVTLRVPPIRLFNLGVIGSIAGTLLMSFDFTIVGIVLAFLSNTFIVTYSPLIAIQTQEESENKLQALSGSSTWWDLGAALGAFLGISLIQLMSPGYLFLGLSALIGILFYNFIIHHARNRTVV